ncbi:MAG: hypothetical protein AB7V77_04435 [Candidatus Woesearchaeota archaeon]
MENERFMGEYEMYQHQIVETMKEYGLICDDEESIIEDYLFKTNKFAFAK